MIISKFVNIRMVSQNIKYYRDLGYEFNNGETIPIKIEDIGNGNRASVKVKCDYCGDEYEAQYANIMNGRKILNKDACKKCGHKKREEILLLLYGVKNPMQLQEIKNRQQDSLEAHYGVRVPAKNKDISKKQAESFKKSYGIGSDGYDEYQTKRRKTCIDKYSVDNASKLEEFKDKAAKTCLEKYGVEHPCQNPDIMEKFIETCNEKYGVDYYLLTKDKQIKTTKTCMDKYGAINISKTDYWKEKVNNSVMERYGTKWVGESKEIQDKIKKTNMERYGVECVFSLEEIRLKSRKTMLEKYGSIMPQCVSSQQNYIHSIYGGELNKQIGKYVADILFTDERIDFEYDGGGHDLSIRLGAISENNFIDKETIRNNYFIKNGYKIFRIISKKDRLPNDSILIEIKNKAFEVLLNTENNIYTYNIDNNTEEYKQINVE